MEGGPGNEGIIPSYSHGVCGGGMFFDMHLLFCPIQSPPVGKDHEDLHVPGNSLCMSGSPARLRDTGNALDAIHAATG